MVITLPDSEIATFEGQLESDHIPEELRRDVRRIVRQLDEYTSGDFPGLTAAVDEVTGRDAATILAARARIVALGTGQFRVNLSGVGAVGEDDERLALGRLILYTLFDDPISTSGSELTVEVGAVAGPCSPFATPGMACPLCGVWPCGC